MQRTFGRNPGEVTEAWDGALRDGLPPAVCRFLDYLAEVIAEDLLRHTKGDVPHDLEHDDHNPEDRGSLC